KAQTVNCISLSNLDLIVSCETTRIFPEANCIFNVSHNEKFSTITENGLNYSSTTTTVNSLTYFNTTCVLYKDISLNDTGQYFIEVSIYPNISGQENDLIYGITKSVNVTI
ncbi:polymorphic transmembrane cluster 2 transmembrane protein 2, partial [Biomphalaria glabrata]